MKPTLRLFLSILTFAACADSAAPPPLSEVGDATIAGARSVSTGVTTLPTFGGSSAEAVAINDAGIVVGYASETKATRTTAAVTYAAKWLRSAGGGWKAPTRLGAPGGRALALNERGDAVGTRDGSVALLWPATGGEITLPDGAVAQGINNAGIIAGGTNWGNRGSALVWIPDANSTSGYFSRLLRPLEGGTYALAFAINEAGVIVGGAVSAAGRDQAVVWLPSADGWSAPVPLSEADISTASSVGYGINAGGDVVGAYSKCLGCGFRASFWPVTGSRVDLSAFYSSTNASHAYGIEDEQRVIGHFYSSNGSPNPFLWQPGNTALTDLGTGTAKDINNRTAFNGQEAVGFRPGSKGSQATVWRVP